MSKKFHFNHKGEISECKATKYPCPLLSEHFTSRKNAEAWLAEENHSKLFSVKNKEKAKEIATAGTLGAVGAGILIAGVGHLINQDMSNTNNNFNKAYSNSRSIAYTLNAQRRGDSLKFDVNYVNAQLQETHFKNCSTKNGNQITCKSDDGKTVMTANITGKVKRFENVKMSTNESGVEKTIRYQHSQTDYRGQGLYIPKSSTN